jgi:type I restriction enzyme M protein
MLTDPILRSQIDKLWDKLWTGGLPNPMDAIEQLSYLLFLKRLDEAEASHEREARQRKQEYTSRVPEYMRWNKWTKLPAAEALKKLKEEIFPNISSLSANGSSFERYMQNAECKINKASLLIEACKAIDEMQISSHNQDIQGDLYEYLLSRLTFAGRNGQFYTPRHIIRMMVKMVDPKPGERIGDMAAGTCGFLVNAYQHILEKNTSAEILSYDEDGFPHNLVGDLLTAEQRAFLQDEAFKGYDNDSGMTMLRIGSMNLMLHGLEHPRFFYTDTLSKIFTEDKSYDVILMNPPFKGAVDEADLSPTLPSGTKKSELLFLHLILRTLDMGGRVAVIVPDGVLFGSSKAHTEIRRKIIEENRLEAVISMPSGVFKPYAGVSTAVLIFTRGATTDKIWFYDMANDGFSLDDKRQPVADNDIPDVLTCWQNKENVVFQQEREKRLEELKQQAAPLKSERLNLQAALNKVTFEHAIAAYGNDKAQTALDDIKSKLAEVKNQIAPLQSEIDQLTRQFWVTKKQVKDNKYDLSASSYHNIEQDEEYYELPQVTMERVLKLEQVMTTRIRELQGFLDE